MKIIYLKCILYIDTVFIKTKTKLKFWMYFTTNNTQKDSN